MKKNLIYIGVGICLIGLWGLSDPLSLTPLAIFSLGLVGGLFFVSWRVSDDFRFLFGIYSLTLCLRVFLTLLFYQLSFLFLGYHEGFFPANDGYGFSENGWIIQTLWRMDVPFEPSLFLQRGGFHSSLTGTYANYDFWNAMVYSVVGKRPLVLFFLNALAGALPTLLIYDLARQLFSRKAARISALLCAFWPSMILWSTQNLRDAIVTYSVVQFVWAAVMLRRRFTFYALCLAAFSLMCVHYLSVHVFTVLFLIAFPLSLIFGSRYWLHLGGATKVLLVCLLISGIVLAIPHLVSLLETRFLRTGEFSLWEWLDQMRGFRTGFAKTAILPDADITSLSKFLRYLPVALVYTLLAPFPWQLGNISQMVGVVEMLFFYSLIPSFLRGTRVLLKYRFGELAVIVFFVPLMLVILASFEGNVGTLFRHRSVVLHFLLLAVAVGWVHGSQSFRAQRQD